MSAAALGALTGSHAGDRLIVHAWLGGVVVAQDLPILDWSIGWDATRQVKGQLSATVTDTDGLLAPWAVDDPLGVGGPRLQAIYAIGGTSETVDVGWFRLTQSDPTESWRVYTLDSADPGASFGERVEWVSSGASIPVDADDLTRLVVGDKLLAPSSPAAGATAISEVRRLLDGIVPVTVAAGVLDAPVPSSVVYARERMDAVEDLLTRISCTHRMTGDGQLEVTPTAPGVVVWSVVGGDQGALVSVQRTQKLDGLYNGVVSDGTDAVTNLPVRGIALEVSGPLHWAGPHGHWPIAHSSPLITSQAMADADAATMLANRVASRSVELAVTCLPHPGLQTGDTVQVACPIIAGQPYPLLGQVSSIVLRKRAPMTMSVTCAYTDVQVVASAVARG